MSHTLRHSQKTYFLSVTYQSAVLQGSFCISELHLSQKILPKENLSKTYFPENKKTHLRNIHCPTDMSENFHICCRFARPGPTPSSISGIACSVCTVDLASCSNVMQCKENFYSLTGLPLNFSERIHHMSSVSQAKVFYFTGRYLQLSVYSMSGNMLRTAQFYIK